MDVVPDPAEVGKVLDEQKRYYEARSHEYLEWWRLENRHEASPEFTRRWEANIAELHAAIDAWPPVGDVLELAAGPGTWTGRLANRFDHVTAVDASASMLSRNRERTDCDNVEFVLADIFDWRPERRYDAAFFAFWVSHVPTTHWQRFWDLVAAALHPGGSVFFLDNAHPDYAQRDGGPGDWPEAVIVGRRDPETPHPADERRIRTLNDGSEWTIIKRWWRPDELVRDLADIGWTAEVHNTDFAFIWGVARSQ